MNVLPPSTAWTSFGSQPARMSGKLPSVPPGRLVGAGRVRSAACGLPRGATGAPGVSGDDDPDPARAALRRHILHLVGEGGAAITPCPALRCQAQGTRVGGQPMSVHNDRAALVRHLAAGLLDAREHGEILGLRSSRASV